MNIKDRYKKPEALRRKNLHVFLLNEKEHQVFNDYCRRYKIENRSKFIRETIISEILGRFEIDHPTLFSDDEMNSMVRR